jgi:ribonucleoside-diphosphate reductase alpha chain
LIKDLVALNLWTKETKDRLIFDKGSVQNLKGLPKFLKDIYKTSYEIDQKMLIKMSADRGIYVCQSQSLNLFFDKPSFKTLTSTHFSAWKAGLKTGMYYLRTRAGTSGQNFSLDTKIEKKFKEEEEEEGCLACSA